MHKLIGIFASIIFLFSVAQPALAATPRPTKTPIATSVATDSALLVSPTPTETASPSPRPDLTQKSEESIAPLEKILREGTLGATWKSPLKHLVYQAVQNGVPVNTLVLLMLLPVVAMFVAGARHIVGLQGFGILLPTALSIAFLALGPLVGIALFLVIVGTSTFGRIGLRKIKLRLHYLPRMSLLLTLTVLALLIVLLLGSTVNLSGVTNISIFPVLFLVVLSEDFIRVQTGKSFRTALNITTQTLLLALISYFFLTLWSLQKFAIQYPEILFGTVVIANIILGKFSGLRVLEYYRFRKLLRK
jgi:hypothetical protein